MKPKVLRTSRRGFLRRTTTTVATFSILPSYVIGLRGATSPNNKLNLAFIGVGGRGGDNLNQLAKIGENVVALCDVDSQHLAAAGGKCPEAKQFQDFRRMFDQMGRTIDAVIISTPDHTHAVAAMRAMQMGKHVYCEKPMAHSIHEVRAMMKAAREYKVVTQLGNQGHSTDSIRTFCEWIWDGAIGNVHTIHAGCDAVNSGIDQLARLREQTPVPPALDWDVWLGPAQQRPYSPVYLPGTWRGWVPFGNGTVGDWTCHVVDPVFWALDLGAPKTIQAKVKDYDFKTQGDAYPKGEIITFEFPAKDKRGPVTLNWYSGTERIPRPPELDADEKNLDTGAVVYGDKATIIYGSHGASKVRIIPEAKMDAYKRPEKTIPRVKEHRWDWLQAIKNGTKAGSDFSYGGPLTEIALLGVIAIKLAGKKLEWDAKQMRFTNSREANQFINPPYRAGWSV